MSARLLMRGSLILGVCIAAGSAPAQQPPKHKAQGGTSIGLTPAPGPKRARGVKGLVTWLTRELQLDARQQEQVKKIAKELMAVYGDSEQREIRMQELKNQIDEARDAGDEQRISRLREQLRRLRSRSFQEELVERIRPVLTEAQLDRLERMPLGRARVQPKRGRPDQLQDVRRLRRELELSAEQKKQFDAFYKELTERLNHPELADDSMVALIEELQRATEAGDRQRIGEIRKELNAARKLTRERAFEHFYEQLMPVLTDEQREIVERVRSGRDRGRRQLDARRLLAIARRLDLKPDQRRALHELERQTRDALREARRDRQARRKLAEEVEKKIRELLDEKQTARFDELLARYRSDRRSGEVKVRGKAGKPARAASGGDEKTGQPELGGKGKETP